MARIAKFRMEIEMENDAMRTPTEVADAIRVLHLSETSGSIYDENGNKVGKFRVPPKFKKEWK